MEADAIDSSKENIQPLRSGRKTQALGVALQAQTDVDLQHKLFLEREEYELLIRMYEGPDPLQPRYSYVLWLEQSFPKHGRESNLVPLLEDTISLFKNDKRYIQDIRFVLLIIKFIETQVNPLELFQVVFNQGIGTMCAILYKAWAEELDLCGDIKRADQVYQMGIKNRAEPLQLLIQEHQQFQLSVGRRLLNGDIDEENDSAPVAEEPVRSVLGRISRKKTGSLRPTLGKAGTVPLCLSNHQTPKANAPIPVYKEPDSENILFGQGSKVEHFPKSESSHKENTVKPGTWNKKYSSGSSHLASAYTPVTPKFKVHEDPDEMLAATPRQISTVPNALKTRKADTFHCPMAIFEPPDPSVQPMYPKHLVYAGGREFQLEEIRAAIYNKAYKEKMIETEMKSMKLSDLGKQLGIATPVCSSALPISNQCQTGLTPMVPQMLKSGFTYPFPVTADRVNQPPKCVSQLKFSPTDASSSISENLLHGSNISTGQGKYGVFCDEEQMCSALSPEEPTNEEGVLSEQRAPFPVFCEGGERPSTGLGPETPKPPKTPSTPIYTIFEEEEDESSSCGQNEVCSITRNSDKTPATCSKNGSSISDLNSECRNSCTKPPPEISSNSAIQMSSDSALNCKNATSVFLQHDQEAGKTLPKSFETTPLGNDFPSKSEVKTGDTQQTCKSSSSSLKSSKTSKSSSRSNKSSKIPFTIYCGD